MQKPISITWLLLLILAVGLCCCIGQPQQGSDAIIDVLKATVTVTSSLTVFKPSPAGASSYTTVIDCSGLQGKPAYVIRCVSVVMINLGATCLKQVAAFIQALR
jgi:hypothetical protein